MIEWPFASQHAGEGTRRLSISDFPLSHKPEDNLIMRKKIWAGSVLQGGVSHQQTRFVSSLSANDNPSQADWTVQRRTQSLTFEDKAFFVRVEA